MIADILRLTVGALSAAFAGMSLGTYTTLMLSERAAATIRTAPEWVATAETFGTYAALAAVVCGVGWVYADWRLQA